MSEMGNNDNNKMFVLVEEIFNLPEEEFKIFADLMIKSRGEKTREILCQMYHDRAELMSMSKITRLKKAENY